MGEVDVTSPDCNGQKDLSWCWYDDRGGGDKVEVC